MSATWKAWLTGAANALLSGLFSGGAALGVGVTWKKVAAIAAVSAIGSLAKWIPQHPLPGALNGNLTSAVIPISSATSNTNQGNVGKI